MTPEAIFKQRDLNTYKSPDSLDTQFEEYVTAFENATFPAISRTIANGRLADNDVVLVTAYLALSKIRNPTLQAGTISSYRQSVETVAKMVERKGGFGELGNIPGYPGKTVTEMIEEYLIAIEINNTSGNYQ